MGIKKVTTTPPPAHPKTKRGRTRHEVTKYQFPLSSDEVAALDRDTEENTVEAILSRAEQWAREVLATAALPTHLEAVRRDADGQWSDDLPDGWRQKKPVEVVKSGESVVTLFGLVEDHPHTPEWFAERILRHAWGSRYHLKRGNARDTAWNTIHLMQDIRMAGFKLDLERLVDLGTRSIQSGGHGKTRSRRVAHKQWNADFERIIAQSPDLSKAEVHRMVAERRNTSEEAVKKALQRLKSRSEK